MECKFALKDPYSTRNGGINFSPFRQPAGGWVGGLACCLASLCANDSSHLIDIPLASKLGPHVALFHNEEEGRLEKFRPYAWPSLDWLRTVQERFNLRVPAENI